MTRKTCGTCKRLQGNSICWPSFVVAFFVVTLAAGYPAQAQVNIDWITVGNPGNGPDQDYGPGAFGSVSNTYRIGETEVTNDQYATFLNAIAYSDPNGVWNSGMDITRSGSDGSYTYASNATFGPNPVNFVSFFNAMRFVNWLENDQPTGAQGAGTTEAGTYTISDGVSETRAGGASFFLPSENEWYKAAYHQPQSAGGDIDDYWLYPTQSNTAPTATTPSATSNSVNFGQAVGDTTDVGAYTGTTGYYGGFDFGGNVVEWNEAVYLGSLRGIRGGSWSSNPVTDLAASFQDVVNPPGSLEGGNIGFRVASSFSETALVPEPSTIAIALMGILSLGMIRRQRNR